MDPRWKPYKLGNHVPMYTINEKPFIVSVFPGSESKSGSTRASAKISAINPGFSLRQDPVLLWEDNFETLERAQEEALRRFEILQAAIH